MFSSALRFLTARLREHRRVLGTRWRRLSTGRQALLPLAHLRNGQPYAQLSAGFGIGATTVYRYAYRGRWDRLSAGQQAVNRSHANLRALVDIST